MRKCRCVFRVSRGECLRLMTYTYREDQECDGSLYCGKFWRAVCLCVLNLRKRLVGYSFICARSAV